MLVLTRKPQESIQIGDDIKITVIKTKGNSVRIGIEAPRETPVLRGELADELHASDATEVPVDEPQTHFARVSRSRVKTLLPELLRDSAPLREMIVRRSNAAV